jgi:hypothetical protein
MILPPFIACIYLTLALMQANVMSSVADAGSAHAFSTEEDF